MDNKLTVLGIDFGLAKVGLAISEGKLAEPYKVIRYKDNTILGETLKRIIHDKGVDKIVVGLSEGKMGVIQKTFAAELSRATLLPVDTFDETLTTLEAQRLAIQAGIKTKKRKEREDAFAAALILQAYLDNIK